MAATFLMHIGELARKAGVSTRTLRFYEEQGLLQPTVKTERGVRIYAPDQVKRLRLIQMLKSLGFSLKKIQHYLSLSSEGHSAGEVARQVREMLAVQIQHAEMKIRQYEQARAEMERSFSALADCLACSDKSPGQSCPCEKLTQKYDELPLMLDMLT